MCLSCQLFVGIICSYDEEEEDGDFYQFLLCVAWRPYKNDPDNVLLANDDEMLTFTLLLI